MQIRFIDSQNQLHITDGVAESFYELYNNIINDLCDFNPNTTYNNITKDNFYDNTSKWIDLKTKELKYVITKIVSGSIVDFSGIEKFPKLYALELNYKYRKESRIVNLFSEYYNKEICDYEKSREKGPDSLLNFQKRNREERNETLHDLSISGYYRIEDFQYLKYFKNLENLKLKNNDVHKYAADIRNFDFLVYLTKLERLDIKYYKCKLYLENAKKLYHLDITGDIDTIELPDTICTITITNNFALDNLNFTNNKKISQLHCNLTSIKNFDALKNNKFIEKLEIRNNAFPVDITTLPVNIKNLTLQNNNANICKIGEFPKLRTVKYFADEIINLNHIITFDKLKYVYFNIPTNEKIEDYYVTARVDDKYAVCENVDRVIPDLSFLKNSTTINNININLVYINDFSVVLSKTKKMTRIYSFWIKYDKFMIVFKYFKNYYLNKELMNNIIDNTVPTTLDSKEFRDICLKCEVDYDTGECKDAEVFYATMRSLTKIHKIRTRYFVLRL
jgi:hypothetical protein